MHANDATDDAHAQSGSAQTFSCRVQRIEDVLDLLAEQGYRCFTAIEGGRLREFGRVLEDTVETNYFFLHRDAHAEQITRLLAR